MTTYIPLNASALASMLREESVFVCDVRDPKAFATSHIRESISFTIPKMLLRRVKSQESPKLEEVLLTNKEDFSRRHSGCNVVVYDQDGSYSDDVAKVLLRCLVTDGLTPFVLQGGFNAFNCANPELCDLEHPCDAGLSISLPSLPCMPMCESDNPFDAPPSDILPHLMMSGERHAQDPAFIRANCITHILNLTNSAFNPEVERIANCMRISLADNTSQDILSSIPEAIRFIDEAKQVGGKVLVHCFAGVSRSAAIALAYFIHSYNMSVDEAYEEIRKKRPCISPNLNFMGQLTSYRTLVQTAVLQVSPTSQADSEATTVADSFSEMSSQSPRATDCLSSPIACDNESLACH